MTRRFIRNSNPNIKELVEEEQCGCGNRMLPYLMKTAAEPCQEPKLSGNIQDPGFESLTVGRSGNITGIPTWDSGEDPETYVPWFQDGPGVGDGLLPDRGWEVSDLNPRSGSKHARLPWEDSFGSSDHSAPGDALWVGEFAWCDNPGYNWAWASLVTPGDITSFSLWAMINSLTGSPHIWVGLWFADSSGNFVSGGDFSQHFALTTSYAQYSTNGTAPAGAKYLNCYISASGAPDPGVLVDVDNCTVSIT